MLKKSVSVLLALCVLFGCLLPSYAADTDEVISVKLNSDVAGYGENDVEKFIEIKSGKVVYNTGIGGALTISDYAGTSVQGKVEAGRTYTVDYVLSAADGYELPDSIGLSDIDIETGKGVTVISVQITRAYIRNADGTFDDTKGLRIFARVVVDGNSFQRLIGLIRDIIIKIRAWSLY